MELRVLGYSVYRTEYHIVWIPKYRRRILNPGVRGYLHKLFPKVMKQLPGCEMVKVNIQVDHIHMLIIIPPKYAVSEVMGIIKEMTSATFGKSLWRYPRTPGFRMRRRYFGIQTI